MAIGGMFFIRDLQGSKSTLLLGIFILSCCSVLSVIFYHIYKEPNNENTK
jgi:hypothetical protein